MNRDDEMKFRSKHTYACVLSKFGDSLDYFGFLELCTWKNNTIRQKCWSSVTDALEDGCARTLKDILN